MYKNYCVNPVLTYSKYFQIVLSAFNYLIFLICHHIHQAHYAIAEYERQCKKKGGLVTVVTQNIDGLHTMAGSKNVIELHGSLFQTRCLKCGDVCENRDSPICPALKDRGL